MLSRKIDEVCITWKYSFFTNISVPEFIDPVFAKTNPTRSFSMIENEHLGLVFAKTGSINSATVQYISEIIVR
jgi:hypothetical protein